MGRPPVPPPYLHHTSPLRQRIQKSRIQRERERERDEAITRIQMTTGRSRESYVEGR
jgi:hypothetical protein